jgi:hypothetical protein
MHHGPCTGRLAGIRKGTSHSTILFGTAVMARLKDITTADRITDFEGSYPLNSCTRDAA